MLRKTYAAIVALALSLGLAPQASAQTLLQDGTTFQGHAVVSGLAPPTLTGCTFVAGTDLAGQCTASAASGSITFAKPFATAPICAVVDASATSTVSMPVYTVSATAITLTTIINAHTLIWICFARTGN